jgi:hypothetical protein
MRNAKVVRELQQMFTPNFDGEVVTDLTKFEEIDRMYLYEVAEFLNIATTKTLLNLLPYISCRINLSNLFFRMEKEDFLFLSECFCNCTSFLKLNYEIINKNSKDTTDFFSDIIKKFYMKEKFNKNTYNYIINKTNDRTIANCASAVMYEKGKMTTDSFLCELLFLYIHCFPRVRSNNFTYYFLNKIDFSNTSERESSPATQLFEDMFERLTENNQNIFISSLIKRNKKDTLLKLANNNIEMLKNKKYQSYLFAIKLAGDDFFNKEKNDEK